MKKRHVLYFILLMICLLTGCTDTGRTQQSMNPDTPNETQAKAYDEKIIGVIKAIDTEKQQIRVYNINYGQEELYIYTGASDITDRYAQIIAASQLTPGEIVDIYYRSADKRIAKMQVSPDAWENNGVSKLKTDATNHTITIAERKYKYDAELFLNDGENVIELIDINARDELTVRGVGQQIYSITVTQGHGYIRLENYKDFVGGTIEVGYGIIMPVVENMLIVAREGKYKVEISNGELAATENIIVKKDKEVTINLDGYHLPEERAGYCLFEIEPFGADLYINGQETDYSDLVKLNYGKHLIKVAMTGYEDYEGVLTVGERSPVIHVNLAEGAAEVTVEEEEEVGDEDMTEDNDDTDYDNDDTDEEDDNNSSDDNNNNDNNDNTDSDIEDLEDEEIADDVGTVKVDADHTITVEAPEGAEVYLNGTLKGTVPVTFDKEIGTHMIVLSQSGYTTKSYTIEIADDDQNITLKFPEMVKSE